MNNTKHMTARKQQRGFRNGAMALTFDLGEFNHRGDRISVGQRDLDDEIDALRQRLKDAERLRRRRGATIVLDGDVLITVYDRTRGGRA